MQIDVLNFYKILNAKDHQDKKDQEGYNLEEHSTRCRSVVKALTNLEDSKKYKALGNSITEQLEITVKTQHSFWGEKQCRIEIPLLDFNVTVSMTSLTRKCITILKDDESSFRDLRSAYGVYKKLSEYRESLKGELKGGFIIFRFFVWIQNLYSNWEIQSFEKNYELIKKSKNTTKTYYAIPREDLSFLRIDAILEAEYNQRTEKGTEDHITSSESVLRLFNKDQHDAQRLQITVKTQHSFWGARELKVEIPLLNYKETFSMNSLTRRCITILKSDKFSTILRSAANELYIDLINFREGLKEKLEDYTFIFRFAVWVQNLYSNWEIQSFKKNYYIEETNGEYRAIPRKAEDGDTELSDLMGSAS